MTNVARKLFILACIVLFLVAAGASGFWFYGAERLKTTIAVSETNWRARGGELAYENLRLSGFPMWFRIQIDKPVAGQPQSRAAWHWQGPPTVRLRTSPFAPRARARFPGEHKLDLTLLGMPIALAMTAKGAEARYRGRGSESLYAVIGEELEVAINGAAPLILDHLDFEVVRLRGTTDHRKPSARFAFEIDDAVLPPGSLPEQFRRQKIDYARLKGTVMGPVASDVSRAAAAAWRDLGGTVEIAGLELRWGPLDIVAVGTMTLDENLQPLAALTATVTGFNETIDALTAAGAIGKNEADAAKALLKLLAKPPRLGGPPEIAVPVTIQNQRLSLGPVALLTLPRLDWPD